MYSPIGPPRREVWVARVLGVSLAVSFGALVVLLTLWINNSLSFWESPLDASNAPLLPSSSSTGEAS